MDGVPDAPRVSRSVSPLGPGGKQVAWRVQSLLGFPLVVFAFLFSLVLGTCRSFFVAPLKLKQVEENADKKC
jgi:hypothetical protein